MSVLIFVGETLPPSNGLLRNNGGWRDTHRKSAYFKA